MGPFTSEIAHHDAHAASDLLLQVQVPGLNVRVLEVRVDYHRGNAGRGAIKLARKSAKRICCYANRQGKGRIRAKSRHDSGDRLVDLETITAANHRILKNVPCKANARLEISHVLRIRLA